MTDIAEFSTTSTVIGTLKVACEFFAAHSRPTTETTTVKCEVLHTQEKFQSALYQQRDCRAGRQMP